MAKTSLEELLGEIQESNEEISTLVENNERQILRNVLTEEVSKIISEEADVDVDDEEDEFEETTVDTITGDEMPDDSEGVDDSEASEEDPEGGDMAVDIEVGLDDTEEPIDGEVETEEIVDLSDMNSEEVMQYIENLPDGEEIQLVKKSSFDVKSDSVSPAEEVPSMDLEEEGYLNEILSELEKVNEEESEESDKLDESNCTKNEETSNDTLDEEIQRLTKATLTESKDTNSKVLALEAEVKKWKGRAIKRRNKTAGVIKELNEANKKLVTTLKEQLSINKKLAVTNTQLMFTSKLFVENSTRLTEKKAIIKKLADAKTVNECKIVYKLLSESLSGRKTKKSILDGVVDTEPKITERKDTKKTTIKESVTFQDKDLKRIKELMEYKSK